MLGPEECVCVWWGIREGGERKRVLRAEPAGQSWEREAGRGTREQGKGQRGCHLGRAPWSMGA